MLSLRERPHHHLLQGRIKAPDIPHVGDVILIKETRPRGTWKIAKIQELVPSQDGQVRSAKIMMANKKVLNRPINLLCPLECPNRNDTIHDTADTDIDVGMGTDGNNAIPNVIHGVVEPRPKRQAAVHATQKI